jgi:hypothetical protein
MLAIVASALVVLGSMRTRVYADLATKHRGIATNYLLCAPNSQHARG